MISHSSIITVVGVDWIEEHVEEGQRWAGSIVVEPRYVDDIANGAMSDGLTVRAAV